MKKLYIETYGCQMNVYDSARIADLLSPLGYVATQSADDADLVILNTCHIREKATEKVYSELGRLKQLKKRNVAAGFNLVLQDDPYLPTDTTAIYPKQVPVLAFFTGSHDDYHRPTDGPEKLNYEGLERITRGRLAYSSMLGTPHLRSDSW